MSEAEREYHLKAIVKKFEGKFVMLETEDKQMVRWLIKDLPDDVHEGTAVRLLLSTAKTDEAARTKLAQTVVNEILNS